MKRRFFMGIVLSAVLSLSCMGTACGHSGESEEMADRTEESIDGLTGTGEGMTSTGDGLNGTGNRSGESGQENNSPMDRAPGTLSELIDKYGTGFVYVSDGEFGGETLEVSIDVELPQAKQMDVVEIMPKWYTNEDINSYCEILAGGNWKLVNDTEFFSKLLKAAKSRKEKNTDNLNIAQSYGEAMAAEAPEAYKERILADEAFLKLLEKKLEAPDTMLAFEAVEGIFGEAMKFECAFLEKDSQIICIMFTEAFIVPVTLGTVGEAYGAAIETMETFWTWLAAELYTAQALNREQNTEMDNSIVSHCQSLMQALGEDIPEYKSYLKGQSKYSMRKTYKTIDIFGFAKVTEKELFFIPSGCSFEPETQYDFPAMGTAFEFGQIKAPDVLLVSPVEIIEMALRDHMTSDWLRIGLDESVGEPENGMPIYPNCLALAYMTVTDGETIALVPAWNFYRSYSSGGTEYDELMLSLNALDGSVVFDNPSVRSAHLLPRTLSH